MIPGDVACAHLGRGQSLIAGECPQCRQQPSAGQSLRVAAQIPASERGDDAIRGHQSGQQFSVFGGQKLAAAGKPGDGVPDPVGQQRFHVGGPGVGVLGEAEHEHGVDRQPDRGGDRPESRDPPRMPWTATPVR